MEIEMKVDGREEYTLDQMRVGVNVFRFPSAYECDYGEDDDSEWEPYIRVDPIELGVKRPKRGTKGKAKRELNVKAWLADNDYAAIVSLRTGIVTVHPLETVVILLKAKVVVEGEI